MNKKDILTVIIGVIKCAQEQSGRDVPDLHSESRIMGDLPGCDSLVLVELSLLLSETFVDQLNGREIPDSILTGAKPDEHPTLDQIATEIEKFIASPCSSSKGSKFKVCSTQKIENNEGKQVSHIIDWTSKDDVGTDGVKPSPSSFQIRLPEEYPDEHNTDQSTDRAS